MKDGVEYILRFGDIALDSSGRSKKDEKDAGEKKRQGEEEHRTEPLSVRHR